MIGYRESFIKDLNLENNKVSVSGFVVSKDANSLVIDDKTGILQIDIENELNLNDYARAFGNLIKVDDKLILKCDFIQNLNEINKELHGKIKELL